MYPLDVTGSEGTYQIVAKSERCLGLRERRSRTVAEWLLGQGVAPFVEMEQAFQMVMPQGFRPGSDRKKAPPQWGHCVISREYHAPCLPSIQYNNDEGDWLFLILSNPESDQRRLPELPKWGREGMMDTPN
jgi:hypothetical protein